MIIIALLAFVIIGPERSQEVALQAGRFLRNIMRSEWWGDFSEITSAMRNLPTTLVRMAELEEAQREIEETMRDINTTAGAEPFRPPPRRPAPNAQPQEPSPQRDMETDPWGIANATAQTEYFEPSTDEADTPPDVQDEPELEEPDDDAAARDN
jgi:Sec-independent protein translocase protein TatA